MTVRVARRFMPLVCVVAVCAGGLAQALAQSGVTRTELGRVMLTGSKTTQVITATLVAAPGAAIPRHTHHGDEFLYVLEGGTIQAPGKEPVELKSGDTLHFPRAMPHGGFTVVGDEPIKVLTVHVVDKDKPLVERVE